MGAETGTVEVLVDSDRWSHHLGQSLSRGLSRPFGTWEAVAEGHAGWQRLLAGAVSLEVQSLVSAVEAREQERGAGPLLGVAVGGCVLSLRLWCHA